MLDVRETPIKLRDLRFFEKNYALNVVYLTEPDVDPSDIYYLKNVPNLEAALVNDKETTVELLKGQDGQFANSRELTEEQKRQLSDAFSIKVAGEMRFVLD
jgi:hypothetical protein